MCPVLVDHLRRRKQKVYQDILGRTTKTETFDWTGAVYSTVVNAYNDRDQVTSITQYAGTTSGTSQVTTMTYDGHGRVTTKHIPQQNANTNTSYFYNPDGTVAQVTDARGAATYYSYTSGGQVSHIGYTVPANSGIPETPDVDFQHDNVGNRVLMEDGLGSVSYTFNSLSQLTSERRNFTDTLTNAPLTNNGYQFDYSYHMGGQLKSLTEPFGATVNYGLDKLGRLNSVAPSSAYGSTSTFVSNAQYKAFGGLKHLEYGNGVALDTTFNNRQQPETFTLGTSSTTIMQKAYQYYADDMLKHVDDQLNWKFDRLNVFDHQGRLQYAKSSSEANGTEITEGWQQIENLPYRQTNVYNAFSNLTSRYNKQWGNDTNHPFTYTFSNNRISGASNGYTTWTNYQYDADGRMTTSDWPDGISESTYDAAAQLVFRHYKQAPGEVEDKTTRVFNGDGREEKRVTDTCRIILPEDPEESCAWQGATSGYYLRSTVLGGEVVTEAGTQGDLATRYVMVGGEKLAQLHFAWSGGVKVDAAQFYHLDPMRLSQRVTRNSPETLLGTDPNNPSYIDPRHAEFDPKGQNVGTVTNYVQQPGGPSEPPIPIEGQSPLYIDGQRATASLDGISMSYQEMTNYINSGMIGGMVGLGQIMSRQIEGVYIRNYTIHMSWGGGDPNSNRVETNTTSVTVGVITGVRYSNISMPRFSIGSNSRQTGPTPIRGEARKRWQSEAERLARMLSFVGDKGKTECRKYLERMGFDVEAIRNALGKDEPFDALNSQNDAGEEFGHDGISVAEYFSNWAKQGKVFSGAATGATGRIYYAPEGLLSLALILHETIHASHRGKGERTRYAPGDPRSDPVTGVISFGPGSSLLSDAEIQTKLGIPAQPDTRNITTELERNGCK